MENFPNRSISAEGRVWLHFGRSVPSKKFDESKSTGICMAESTDKSPAADPNGHVDDEDDGTPQKAHLTC